MQYFRISRSNIFDHLQKSTFWGHFWEQNFCENLSCQYEHVIFVKYDSWVMYSSKYSSFINLLPFFVDTKIRFSSKSNFHKPFKIPYKVPSYKILTNEKKTYATSAANRRSGCMIPRRFKIYSKIFNWVFKYFINWMFSHFKRYQMMCEI